MARGKADSPTNVLKSALEGPFPELRKVALRIIAKASAADSWGECAERLGVPIRSLHRLREEHPEAFVESTRG